MLTPLLGSLHWLPLTTRRGFGCLCGGEGAFHNLAPAVQPHPSLLVSGKAGLCCLNKQHYHFRGLAQGSLFLAHAMSPLWVCRGVPFPMDLGWRRLHLDACFSLRSRLGRGKAATHSVALRASTWKWHTVPPLMHPWPEQVTWPCLTLKLCNPAKCLKGREPGIFGKQHSWLEQSPFLFTKCLAYCPPAGRIPLSPQGGRP